MPDKDILLLDPATGKPVCRKEVSTLVDQSSIIGNSEAATPFRVNYPVVAGALAGSGVAANAGKLDAALVHNATGTTANATSGAGTTASPLTARQATDALTGVVELTGSAQMPAERTRDNSALTPAGAAKLVGYIKPVASTGALSAAQQSADAIEVPMLSNFSCNGGTRGAPRYDVPVAGGGSCAIDLGNLPYYSVDNPPPGGGPFTPGQVVFNGTAACVALPPGVYSVLREPNAGMGATAGPFVHVLTGGDFPHTSGAVGKENLQCAAPVVSLNGGFDEAGPLIAGTAIGWGWHPAGGGILGAAMIITYVGGI